MKFLAIGELMIELAPKDTLFAMNFAGDTFNTAWYLQQAAPDADVGYLSAIGDDEPSRQMERFVEDAGITPHLKVRENRSVGLYMVSLKDGERSFSYWRDTSAARSLADDLETLPVGKGDIAYFSGITLAILPTDGRERLLSVLKNSGAYIAFDPNLRPRLWASVEDMCTWVMKGAEVSDLCLPSYEDEAQYFGDSDPAATAARYAKRGTKLVVVKNGPDPVLILDDGITHHVQPKPVSLVTDTTAAGDSFNAQFIASRAQGMSVEDAAASACVLSAKVIGKIGALVK